MDIRDRVMGDMPDSFFHKIAGIVPGYKGYVDKERRRDADRLLRTHIARQYAAQRDRLNRIQGDMVRARQLGQIDDVDRIAGVLQRFIDRLQTATYGYTGLFDPIKLEAGDLDQIYAFDMALASGVDQVSSAIDGVESSVKDAEELPTALQRLSGVVDTLNERLNQRADLISTGRRLPGNEYNAMLGDITSLQSGSAGAYGGAQTGGQTGAGSAYTPYSSYSGGGMESDAGTTSSGGTPTSNFGSDVPLSQGVAAGAAGMPGMSAMTEGNQGLGETPAGDGMGSAGVGGPMPAGDTAGGAIESASSPSAAPGAPGGDIVDGLRLESSMGGGSNLPGMPNTSGASGLSGAPGMPGTGPGTPTGMSSTGGEG